MPLRRILVALLLVMIVMSVAASLTSHTTKPTAPALPLPSTAGALARTVSGTLPDDRLVRAAVGDRVVLEVKADVADQVQIAGYDLIEVVDPLAPANFDFVADQPGRFGVRLLSTGEVVGRLEVVERP
jgi:hypothetical protein